MSKQPPPAPVTSAVGPCPTISQIRRTPRHWKFTQHHHTTQPPHRAFEQSNKHVKEIRDTKEQHVHKASPNIPENRSKQKKKFQYSTDHVTNRNSSPDSVSHRGKSTKRPGVTPNKQKSCIFCGYNHEMQKVSCLG